MRRDVFHGVEGGVVRQLTAACGRQMAVQFLEHEAGESDLARPVDRRLHEGTSELVVPDPQPLLLDEITQGCRQVRTTPFLDPVQQGGKERIVSRYRQFGDLAADEQHVHRADQARRCLGGDRAGALRLQDRQQKGPAGRHVGVADLLQHRIQGGGPVARFTEYSVVQRRRVGDVVQMPAGGAGIELLVALLEEHVEPAPLADDLAVTDGEQMPQILFEVEGIRQRRRAFDPLHLDPVRAVQRLVIVLLLDERPEQVIARQFGGGERYPLVVQALEDRLRIVPTAERYPDDFEALGQRSDPAPDLFVSQVAEVAPHPTLELTGYVAVRQIEVQVILQGRRPGVPVSEHGIVGGQSVALDAEQLDPPVVIARLPRVSPIDQPSSCRIVVRARLRRLGQQRLQTAPEVGEHEIHRRESLLAVDDVEDLEARIPGLLRHHDRPEEVFLLGEAAVLRGVEHLLLEVLLELIPVPGAPHVSALKERDHVAHFTREDVGEVPIDDLAVALGHQPPRGVRAPPGAVITPSRPGPEAACRPASGVRKAGFGTGRSRSPPGLPRRWRWCRRAARPGR